MVDAVPGADIEITSRRGTPPLLGAPPEEVGLVVRWLSRPGVRIVRTTEGYRLPIYGAARWRGWADAADAAARSQPLEEAYLERLG